MAAPAWTPWYGGELQLKLQLWWSGGSGHLGDGGMFVTARIMQGMARVRSGQAPLLALPVVSLTSSGLSYRAARKSQRSTDA